VPLQPFMGVMGLAPATGVFVGSTPNAPPPATGVQSSTQPGPFGGNMDNKLLTIGATLYLPVFQHGGQFYTGDSHSAQGDGEVSGTAIEHSLSGLFRFILQKGKTIQWPRAEDDTYYIFMGIDQDLDRAMRIATLEVIKFLVEEKGLTDAEAFSLASIGVDFAVSEVVDGTQVVSGKVAKSLFLKSPTTR
jgi:acetamidase/formamidase